MQADQRPAAADAPVILYAVLNGPGNRLGRQMPPPIRRFTTKIRSDREVPA
ncbi:hypothetical protein [Actinomadura sp. 21ATH]|uniref:hypothetical protein n=1 Tax=Actinomadura sp. 21ATH TaxID=1735444 RepID=UPI0035C1D982